MDGDADQVAGFNLWAVRVAGEPAARIWVTRGEFTPLDRRAVEHASLVFALEFARLRTAVEVELRLRGELLTDVLGGAPVDSPSVRDRAGRLGHDLSGPAVAVVGRVEPAASARRPVVEQRVLAAAAELADRFRPRPLVGMYRGLLVALWPPSVAGPIPVPDPAAAADAVRRAMRAVPGLASATVSVAGPVGQHPQAYRTARGALEIALAGRAERT